MITTIILLIILIKLISFKVFLGFMATYSFIYLYIKYMKEEALIRGEKGNIINQEEIATATGKQSEHIRMKFHYHKHKGQVAEGEVAIDTYGIGKKGEMMTEASAESSTEHHQKASSGSHTERFMKSTVTIRKIIVRKTLSTTKNELIIKKSRILKTKKIVTIKSAII